MDNATSPIYPSLLNATPPIAPDSNTTQATPRLAPELIPNTDGPASGFRKTVCICKPLTDSPAPATNAVNACGTRDFQMMFCQIMDSSVFPHKMFQTERKGIWTEPNSRFSKKNRNMDASITSIRSSVGLFIANVRSISVGNQVINRGGTHGSDLPTLFPVPSAYFRRKVARAYYNK